MSLNLYSIGLKFLTTSIIIISVVHFYFGLLFLFSESLNGLTLSIVIAQMLFELVFFFQIYILFISIINSIEVEGKNQYVTHLENYPQIDVVIPIKNVDPQDLEETLIGVRSAEYDQQKIFITIGDDTEDSDLRNVYQELCTKYNATYFYSKDNGLYKAGMLNLILGNLKCEFLVCLDYDQIPHRHIFSTFISYFNSNPEIGYIQAKKEFRKLSNLSKIWSAGLYSLFFEIFQRNKILNDTVFFSGSTACFRTRELIEMGGFPTYSFTEDNSLTLSYLLSGKKTIYFDKVGSIGLVPRTYRLQISQLWRWSNGASMVLRNQFWNVMKSPKLKKSQKIDILGTLSIAPVVVAIYVYSMSFIPLILMGIDSQRFTYYNLSSIILVPILVSLTYIFLIATSIYLSHKSEYSEYRYRDIPGFVIIALASNLLTITSGLSGLFNWYGPKSKRGEWTRNVKIIRISSFFFVIGIIIIYYSVIWFLAGFNSALITLLIGFTFLPSLFISLYYEYFKKE